MESIMAIRDPQNRSMAPLILAMALLVLGQRPLRGRADARVEPVLVDPSRAPAPVLESLEGMGAEGARRLVEARAAGRPLDLPEDLVAVPGVGTRTLHRWHRELAFAGEAP
jgi:DNA uptake protein ComE-like DNA-binding protein